MESPGRKGEREDGPLQVVCSEAGDETGELEDGRKSEDSPP